MQKQIQAEMKFECCVQTAALVPTSNFAMNKIKSELSEETFMVEATDVGRAIQHSNLSFFFPISFSSVHTAHAQLLVFIAKISFEMCNGL